MDWTEILCHEFTQNVLNISWSSVTCILHMFFTDIKCSNITVLLYYKSGIKNVRWSEKILFGVVCPKSLGTAALYPGEGKRPDIKVEI